MHATGKMFHRMLITVESLTRIVRADAVSSDVARLEHAEACPPFPVDRDWLCEQYVTRNRTLTDIATELGTSNSNITHRLRALGIPFRGHAAPTSRCVTASLTAPPAELDKSTGKPGCEQWKTRWEPAGQPRSIGNVRREPTATQPAVWPMLLPMADP